jgi:hypothetical protein
MRPFHQKIQERNTTMPTLTWLDHETAVKAAEAVPFRVLDFNPKLSAGDPAADRLIIHGDNLNAVKAFFLWTVKQDPKGRYVAAQLRAKIAVFP